MPGSRMIEEEEEEDLPVEDEHATSGVFELNNDFIAENEMDEEHLHENVEESVQESDFMEIAPQTLAMEHDSLPPNKSPTKSPTKSPRKSVRIQENPKRTPKTKAKDPWKLLDPHDGSSKSSRPLRVGNTIRLPDGITTLPSQSVNGSSTKIHPRRRPRRSSHKKEISRLPPATYVHGCFRETLRAERARSMRRHTDSHDGDGEEREPKLSWLKSELAFGEEFRYVLQKEKRRRRSKGRENLQPEDLRRGCDPDHFDDEPAFDLLDAMDHDECQDPISDEPGVQAEAFHDAFQDDDDTRLFEDLCRAHRMEFSKGAEKYAVETKLSKRVHLWQQRLKPILQTEEERSQFDIHRCGAAILRGVEDHGTLDFGLVAEECAPYQVSRYFLATLMLANRGNVSLCDGTGTRDVGDGWDGSLELTLVNAEFNQASFVLSH